MLLWIFSCISPDALQNMVQGTALASSGKLLEIQNPGSCSRPTKSEPAFQQDPWGTPSPTKDSEALAQCMCAGVSPGTRPQEWVCWVTVYTGALSPQQYRRAAGTYIFLTLGSVRPSRSNQWNGCGWVCGGIASLS